MTFAQLADVPRPVVVTKRLFRLVCQGDRLLRCEAAQEVCGQERDVLAALAERRDAHRADVDPVEQVGTEQILRHEL